VTIKKALISVITFAVS